MAKKTKHGHHAPRREPAGIAHDAVCADEEFELKLEVDPANLDALRAAWPLNADTAIDRRQDSVYFDTPTRALHDAGFSLRIRTIGDRRIQTIKAEGTAAAGLFVRPEWEREIASDAPVLDDDAPFHGLIAPKKLARLAPIFQVSVVRRTVLVERDGSTIEIVLDHGDVRGEDHADTVSELELELKQGDPTSLFALARDLARIAPLRLGVLTKSDRGYRLGTAAADKPVKSGPLALSRGLTTAAGFQAIVGACLRQFRRNEAILARTGDAGALHQARVALRRLRSALSTFKHIVQDDRYDHIRTELRWIAGELGQARNLDVLLARVSDKAASKPLRTARTKAYKAAHRALASARLRALMLDLSEWTAIGPWLSDPARRDDRHQPIEAFAAIALSTHRRRLKRRGRALDEVGDEHRHEARIEAKKLRYASEFFASLFPRKKSVRRYRNFATALGALQSHLGDLNDLATAPIVLAELGLVGTPTAEALQPDLSSRAPLLANAVDAYDTLMDLKRFWR